MLNTLGLTRTGLDFKHYFKQVYESSISSGKALKNLTSKLRSVGSTSFEPQPGPPVDQPERVFKVHVAYDVSYPTHRNILGWLIPPGFSDLGRPVGEVTCQPNP